MKIIYDAAKNTSNAKKHGVTLAEAAAFEWDTAVLWPDQRKEYGEDRMIALGYIGSRIFCMTFVDRQEGRRIMSLRKANNREVKRYAST